MAGEGSSTLKLVRRSEISGTPSMTDKFKPIQKVASLRHNSLAPFLTAIYSGIGIEKHQNKVKPLTQINLSPDRHD